MYNNKSIFPFVHNVIRFAIVCNGNTQYCEGLSHNLSLDRFICCRNQPPTTAEQRPRRHKLDKTTFKRLACKINCYSKLALHRKYCCAQIYPVSLCVMMWYSSREFSKRIQFIIASDGSKLVYEFLKSIFKILHACWMQNNMKI